MPSLTPKLASEIANIPYGVYQGQGRLAFREKEVLKNTLHFRSKMFLVAELEASQD